MANAKYYDGWHTYQISSGGKSELYTVCIRRKQRCWPAPVEGLYLWVVGWSTPSLERAQEIKAEHEEHLREKGEYGTKVAIVRETRELI